MEYYEYLEEITQNRDKNFYVEYKKRCPYLFNKGDVKPIAFYLPQFYTFPENDKWWGKGFTEWTNVSKALPQFEGHYQPRLPGELGFYSLDDINIIRRQCELAQQYGIYGFCFYFYMFNSGKRLLEKPINKFLANKDISMPFCISFANENWNRRWDGLENEILIKQTYESDFFSNLVDELKIYVSDSRYIKIKGRPVIIIYRLKYIPEYKKFAKLFREKCLENGIGEVYLVSTLVNSEYEDTRIYGFDDCLEFPPHYIKTKNITDQQNFFNPLYSGKILSYSSIVKNEISKQIDFSRFRGVMTSWDNEARRNSSGTVIFGANPKLFELWLNYICKKTVEERSPEDRFVFINAWNEWAEGAYLEPDRRYGYGYLEAVYNAVINFKKKLDIDDFIKIERYENNFKNERDIKVDNLIIENQYLKNEISTIKNSKIWKLYKVLKYLKKKLINKI